MCLRTFIIVFVGLVSRAVIADDWPQWRGPGRDGVWHEKGIAERFGDEGLKVVWRAPVGSGWSSPVVARGRAVVTDVKVTGTHASERIICLDEAGGKELWTHVYPVDYPDWALKPEGGGPRATPIVFDGKVYSLGAMGNLFCLDAVKGTVTWEKDLAKAYQMQPFTGITASPLIDGDLLILYICGTPGACVVALDKNSGKEIWRALDDHFTYSSPIVLQAGGQKQLIVWTQEAVSSLDPQTGKSWWRLEMRTPGDMAIATPVYSDGRLLVGGLMLKLDEKKPAAEILWPQAKLAEKRVLSVTSTALLQGDNVYSAKNSGELVCLDAQTGRQIWATQAVTSLKNGCSIHITPCGNSAILFTDQGNLIRARLDRDGYHEISRAMLLEPTYSFGGRKVVWPPPAYANGHVFARSDKEIVCALLAQ